MSDDCCCCWTPIKLIFWWIFGGLISACLWWIAGLILCLTIVGAPFGSQCFKIASLCLDPFDKDICRKDGCCSSSGGCCGFILNILWLPMGIFIALFHVLQGIIFAVSIIGIPCAKQHFKLADLAIWPFGSHLEEETQIIVHNHHHHHVVGHQHANYGAHTSANQFVHHHP
jgi:uncharacterized membrane protein YccF (DUF307 family)